MKICFLSTDFPPTLGGVASHAYELAKALVKQGHEVHVITSRVNDSEEEQILDGIQVHRPKILWQKPFYNWSLKKYLKGFLHKNPIDIIHVHGLRPLESTTGLDYPIIFTNHTSGFLKRLEKPKVFHLRLLARMRHVDMILAPSVELCDASIAVGYKGPVHFVSNGVDTQRFTPLLNKQIQPIKKLLLARRLVEKNGVIVFAEAITKVKSQNFELIIAGDGAERSKMVDIFQNAGIQDKVKFLGGVKNSEMPAIYQQADFSVLPSFYEATSITGLESMASGLPLIGTNVGGIPYLIEEGKTGALVPSHDAVALAAKIDEFLLMSDEEYQSMSQATRLRTQEVFDWQVIAKETVGYYQKVCS